MNLFNLILKPFKRLNDGEDRHKEEEEESSSEASHSNLHPAKLPSEIWIQITQSCAFVIFPFTSFKKEALVTRLDTHFSNQASTSYSSSWTGGSPTHASPFDLSLQPNRNRKQLINISIQLSSVSKHVYDSISHLRYLDLTISDLELFQHQQLSFFRANPNFSSNVVNLQVLLPPPKELDLTLETRSIEAANPMIKTLDLEPFRNLRTLDLRLISFTNETNPESIILLPDLCKVSNLKVLIIGILEWIKLLALIQTSTSIDSSLPKLDQLIVESYSLVSRSMFPLRDSGPIHHVLTSDLETDLKSNGVASFLKQLLRIRKLEPREILANDVNSSLASSELPDEGTGIEDERKSIVSPGELIIKPGLPHIVDLCVELKRKLEVDLDIADGIENKEMREFIVLGEFKSWVSIPP